jgi:prepilin-type processing-associated H-X9-DG protein/prepilin-type N-terminal cleavage/methylation domain-containing protein
MRLVILPARRAYTLIELLVVIGIASLLTGLTLAGVQRIRESANAIQCKHNLHQLGLSLHHYHDTNGAFPPAVTGMTSEHPFMSWLTRLLPFIEQPALWNSALEDYQRSRYFWLSPRHSDEKLGVNLYECPSEPRKAALVMPEDALVAFTHYLGVSGQNALSADGCLYMNSHVRLGDITDGTSTTLAVGERPPSPDMHFGWWYAGTGQKLDGSADMHLGVRDYVTTFRAPMCPRGPSSFHPGDAINMCDVFHFWSRHPGGAHFLWADGSVRFLTYGSDSVLPALASRSGGEAVNPLD